MTLLISGREYPCYDVKCGVCCVMLDDVEMCHNGNSAKKNFSPQLILRHRCNSFTCKHASIIISYRLLQKPKH